MPYKDKVKQREAQARYQRKKRAGCIALVRELKKDVPCADCGKQYPHYVMDYDHINGDKVHGIGYLAGIGHRAALLRELPKCELVCSNCHRERTWGSN